MKYSVRVNEVKSREGSNIEELMEKANSVDWSKVNTEKKFTGSRFDFTI